MRVSRRGACVCVEEGTEEEKKAVIQRCPATFTKCKSRVSTRLFEDVVSVESNPGDKSDERK